MGHAYLELLPPGDGRWRHNIWPRRKYHPTNSVTDSIDSNYCLVLCISAGWGWSYLMGIRHTPSSVTAVWVSRCLHCMSALPGSLIVRLQQRFQRCWRCVCCLPSFLHFVIVPFFLLSHAQQALDWVLQLLHLSRGCITLSALSSLESLVSRAQVGYWHHITNLLKAKLLQSLQRMRNSILHMHVLL